MDLLSPRNLYLRMEKEREQNEENKSFTQEQFVPMFIVQLINDYLNASRIKPEEEDIMEMEPTTTITKDVKTLQTSFLIDQNVKTDLQEVLHFADCVKSQIGLDLHNFCKQFCKQIKNPPLELIWELDCQYNLMSFTSYLMELSLNKELWSFSDTFLSFCFSRCILDSKTRGNSREILGKFLETFIISSICGDTSIPLLHELKTFSSTILKEITFKLIETTNDSTIQTIKESLVTKIQTLSVCWPLKKKYLLEQLKLILTKKSKMSAEDVIQKQEVLITNDYINSKETTIKMLIETLQAPLETLQVITNLASELNTSSSSSSVDFESILRTINIWNELYGASEFESIRFLQGEIKRLMIDGLSNNLTHKIMVSLLLARQCSLIAPKTFFTYEKWYCTMFQQQYSVAREPSSFINFVNFLTKLIPNEPPRFIQVHATYSPTIPEGCKEMWNDYVTAVRARIQEYNEIEDAMSLEPNLNPLQNDVDKAIKSFDGTSVPQWLATKHMFEKEYYFNKFLPALLRKPIGNPNTDARLRLIEVLNKANLMPKDLYKKHKSGKYS